jgi:anthranilate/para-aminobenzoate synthase component I
MSESGTAAVRTVRRPVPTVGALDAYVALAGRFGPAQVCLLESAGGPADDCRHNVLGFGELLAVSVTRGEVLVTGPDELRELVLAAIAPWLECAFGVQRLRTNRTLWDLLRAVESVFDAERSATSFEFGFFGFFGYDTAHYIEELPFLVRRGQQVPDVHLVLYQGVLREDLATGRSELLVHQSARWPDLDVDEVAALLGTAGTPPAPGEQDVTGTDDDVEREAYLSHVDKALQHIAIGDIYQVQIGHELTLHSEATPLEVYQRLRARNASPYMCLAPVREHTVVGASPELFVRLVDGEVVMRPIAGTIPRGVLDDRAAGAKLRNDPKEIAEHVMLVDLCRNDIGRICARDTLGVRDEMVVEQYSHVLHLVSTVVGRIEPGTHAFDVIAAMFPAGTMTGAPKIRAMEIIEEVEAQRRGLYAGALGLIGLGGYLNLSLCIRTLVHNDGAYRTRASAGVVADSDADREWTETLAKSSAAYWAVTGKELLP